MASEDKWRLELPSQPSNRTLTQHEAAELPSSQSLEMLLRKLRTSVTYQDDKFANIMDALGEFGTFQRRLVAMCFIPNILAVVFMYADVFVATQQKPYCNTSWILALDPNLSEAEQMNLTLPRDTNGSFQTCLMYLPDNHKDLDSIIQFGLNYTQSCINGWIYPESKTRSMVNEFDLVCGEAFDMEAVQSMFLTGLLIGALIFGLISDKLGRYPSILLSNMGIIIFGFGSAFVNSFHQYLFFRFGVSQSLVGFSITTMALTAEWLVGEHRAHALVLSQCCFSLGLAFLTGLAYSLPHWRLLFLVGTAPVFFLVSFFWILPESPRWLVMKGKVEEAKQVLRQAAYVNKKTIPLNLLDKLPVPGQNVANASILDFYSNSQLRKVTLVMGCVWFTIGHSFSTLLSKMRDFGVNRHIVELIPGMMGLPARLFCIFLFEQFGRKWTMAGTLFQGSFMNLLILFIPKEMKSTTLLMILIGQISLVASITTFFAYTAELFPTVLRTTGLGLVTLAWASGSIVALALISWSPPTISNYLGFISAAFSLSLFYMLPETHNQPLTDSLDQFPPQARGMSKDLSKDEFMTEAKLHGEMKEEVTQNIDFNTVTNSNPDLINVPTKAQEETSGRQDD